MNRYNSALGISAIVFAVAALAMVGWTGVGAQMGDRGGPGLARPSTARPLNPSGYTSNLQAAASGQPQGISVTGEARTTAEPDQALLEIGVTSMEPTVGTGPAESRGRPGCHHVIS